MWNLKGSIAGTVCRSQYIQPIALPSPRKECLLCRWPNYVKSLARTKGLEPFRQLQVDPNEIDLSTIYGNVCKKYAMESFMQKECPCSSTRRPATSRSFPKSTKPSVTKERLSPAALQHTHSYNLPRQRIERTSPETNISKSTRPRRSFTKDKSYKIAQEPQLKSVKSIQEKHPKAARIKSNSTIRSGHSNTRFKRKQSVGSMSLKSVDLVKIVREMSVKRPNEKEYMRNDFDSEAEPVDPFSTLGTEREDDPTNSVVSMVSSAGVAHDLNRLSSIFYLTSRSTYNLPDFLPINIMKHKDEFLSVHSLERNFKDTMPKIWPRTEPDISRQQRKEESMPAKTRSEGDDRLARRIHRLKMTKAVGCQTSSADSSYKCVVCHRGEGHLHPYYQQATNFQQHRKNKRSLEVACQTEPTICILCQIERQPEPDEPYMIAMKQRRQREDLLVYYRQMERPKQPPAPTKSQPKRTLRQMRKQLELYLEILAHCDRVVDDKLYARTARILAQQC